MLKFKGVSISDTICLCLAEKTYQLLFESVIKQLLYQIGCYSISNEIISKQLLCHLRNARLTRVFKNTNSNYAHSPVHYAHYFVQKLGLVYGCLENGQRGCFKLKALFAFARIPCAYCRDDQPSL